MSSPAALVVATATELDKYMMVKLQILFVFCVAFTVGIAQAEEVSFTSIDEIPAATPSTYNASSYASLNSAVRNAAKDKDTKFSLQCRKDQSEGAFCKDCKTNITGKDKSLNTDALAESMLPNFIPAFQKDPVMQKIKLLIYDEFVKRISTHNLTTDESKTIYNTFESLYYLNTNHLIEEPDTFENMTYKQTSFYRSGIKKIKLKSLPKNSSADILKAYNYITEQTKNEMDSPPIYKALLQGWKITLAKTLTCNITVEEYLALAKYLGSDYKEINAALRTNTHTKELSETVQFINQALDKLESYDGYVIRNTEYVYAMQSLPESVYKEHTAGSILAYSAFTSSSVLKHWQGNFIIRSHHGKLIAALRPNDNEGEVLFKPGTKFKVLYNSCEVEKKEKWKDCNVIMEEVL